MEFSDSAWDNIKSSSDLLASLKKATSRPMTPEERFEQRVSFVYGQLSEHSPLTKDDVRRILMEQF